MEGRKAEGRARSHHKNLAIAGVLGDGLDDEQRRHSSVVEFSRCLHPRSSQAQPQPNPLILCLSRPIP